MTASRRVESPTRVLFLATALARTSGGGQTFIGGLVDALETHPDVDVTVVYPAGFSIRSNLRRTKVRPLVGVRRILRDLLWANYWAHSARADIVVTPHEWTPPILGKPSVNIIQNILYLQPQKSLRRRPAAAVMKFIIRITACFAHTTICVSAQSIELWKKIRRNYVLLIPEGIDEVFSTAAGAPERRTITIVSGDSPHKQPEFATKMATEATARHPDFKVEVIGVSGPDKPARWLSPRALAELFASSRVVLITSTIESFGLPAFEARHCGAWVIVNSDTAMADWLRDDAGTIVVPKLDKVSTLDAIASSAAALPPMLGANFLWSQVGPQWASSLCAIGSKAKAKHAR